MEKEIGFCAGEMCNRDGCEGTITESSSEESCRCHICAPCSSCCNTSQYCEECGWDNDEEWRQEESRRKKLETSRPKEEVKERVWDENKVYSILRYFDTYFEATVAWDLSEKEAYDKALQLGRNTAYVTYSVKKQ
mgnify:CR=1 FL=1